jgi:threonine synthase
VATVEGAPVAKIRQMQLYGADISLVTGFGKDAGITSGVFTTLADFVRERSLPLPISAYCYCEEGMQGVQTIAYEILDEMVAGVDHIFSPAGGGGLCLAMAKGVLDYKKNGLAVVPKLHCVQPVGNNTIAGPLRENRTKAVAVTNATTTISGLQVASVLDGDEVIRLYRELKGNGFLVQDQQVFRWQQLLATKEGIFSEPAGAVALAGLACAMDTGEVNKNERVVCLVTGSGFKDMNSVENNFKLPAIRTIENRALLKNELTNL